jgi:hypothetical protein
VAGNPDGSATCDRCGIWLAGFGVLYGMVCTDIDASGRVRDHIYCYTNQCRTAVLDGLVNYPQTTATETQKCTHCNRKLDGRSVAEAMLTQDVLPSSNNREARSMAFCYANGGRDLLIAQAGAATEGGRV